MQIDVSDPQEFERLLDALSHETVTASIHFKLYSDLQRARATYGREFNESWTFWSLTLQSHWDTTLFRLCKIYDKDDRNGKTLNLTNLLDTIEANLSIFDVEHFRKRLTENPFVESLASGITRPDMAELASDKRSVSDTDPLVKALVFWRNNFFAHRNAKPILTKKNLADRYPLNVSDVRTLLDRAVRILGRYSIRFRASSYSTQIVGHDDYLVVLRAMQSVLVRQDDELARDLDRYR